MRLVKCVGQGLKCHYIVCKTIVINDLFRGCHSYVRQLRPTLYAMGSVESFCSIHSHKMNSIVYVSWVCDGFSLD